jgi:hypothetical protein
MLRPKETFEWYPWTTNRFPTERQTDEQSDCIMIAGSDSDGRHPGFESHVGQPTNHSPIEASLIRHRPTKDHGGLVVTLSPSRHRDCQLLPFGWFVDGKKMR